MDTIARKFLMTQRSDRMIWWLLRHFTTEPNENGIAQGSREFSLSDRGREELKTFTQSNFFQPVPELIFSSPQKRALETAASISDYYQIPVVQDVRLREWETGELEGRSIDEYHRMYPEFQIQWDQLDFRYPNGESKQDLYTRVISFYEELLNETKIPLIVGHQGSLNCLIGNALHFPPNPWMPFRLKTGGLAAIDPFANYAGLKLFQGSF